MDGLRSFEFDPSDPLTAADGMVLRLTLGPKTSENADQEAMLAFGGELFAAASGR
ncbi:MAG TPA: hypothetical protein VGJ97_10970 [Anaerolineaceae bacterium]